MTSSMAWRLVTNFLPYSLPTFSRPHRLSVGALTAIAFAAHGRFHLVVFEGSR